MTSCHAVGWPGYRTTAWHKAAKPLNTNLWFGSLVDEMRDASGQMYMRNRYYDPATGQFTQADPIGLAGGLNAYGFAGGDPVSYADPYGLKVCFRGKAAEVNKLADSTRAATGTTFDLDKGNCVKNVRPADGKWDEVSAGLARLAKDDLVNIPIEFGTGGSRNDASGTLVIDPADFNRRYFVKGCLGFCWSRGRDTYGGAGVIAHELGHAYTTLYDPTASRSENNRVAVSGGRTRFTALAAKRHAGATDPWLIRSRE